MPSWAKVILANSRAEGTARLVLLALGETARKDGLCSMRVAKLAELAATSVRQVQYDLPKLIALDELQLVTAGKGGRGAATVYRITMQSSAPFPCQKRVQSTKGVFEKQKPRKPLHPFTHAGARAHNSVQEKQRVNGAHHDHDDDDERPLDERREG